MVHIWGLTACLNKQFLCPTCNFERSRFVWSIKLLDFVWVWMVLYYRYRNELVVQAWPTYELARKFAIETAEPYSGWGSQGEVIRDLILIKD